MLNILCINSIFTEEEFLKFTFPDLQVRNTDGADLTLSELEDYSLIINFSSDLNIDNYQILDFSQHNSRYSERTTRQMILAEINYRLMNLREDIDIYE